jgi:hypothetical protein
VSAAGVPATAPRPGFGAAAGRPAGPPAAAPRPIQPPAGGGPPGRPYQAFTGGPGGSGPSSGSRTKVAAVAAGLVTVLVVTITLIALNSGGGGGPGPNPTPTLAGPSSSGASTPNTEFDRFFTSVQLRDYARPFYGEMSSCEEESTASAAAAQCVFDDGHEVLLFELPEGASLEVWRTTLSNSPQMEGASKGTWSKGAKWTVQKSGGSALYWDTGSGRLGGLAVKADESLSDLDDWWSERFGR